MTNDTQHETIRGSVAPTYLNLKIKSLRIRNERGLLQGRFKECSFNIWHMNHHPTNRLFHCHTSTHSLAHIIKKKNFHREVLGVLTVWCQTGVFFRSGVGGGEGEEKFSIADKPNKPIFGYT